MRRVGAENEEPKVVKVRMFVDDATGIGLWPQDADLDDVDLPLPESVRVRVQQWANEYADRVNDANFGWPEEYGYDHDKRGYALSREVAEALGEAFRVVYEFETDRLRREVCTPTD